MRRQTVAPSASFGSPRSFGAMAGLLLLLGSTANAQSESSVTRGAPVDRYSPQAGDGDILGVQSPAISAHLLPRIMASVGYADPHTTLTLSGSIGLIERVELGFALPVLIPRASPGSSSVALSDLRVQAKVRLFDSGGFSVGASLPVTVPTSNVGAGFTASPTLLAQWARSRSAVLLDVGLVLRQPQLNLALANAVAWSIAGKVDLIPLRDLSLMASIGGEVPLLGATAPSPIEGLVALRWMPVNGLALTLGAGPSFAMDGGAPRFHVVASIGWVPGWSDRPAHPVQSAAADEAFLNPLRPVAGGQG